MIPAALILVLPLSRVIAKRQDIAPYLQFPPRPVILTHAPFSFFVFGIIFLFIAATTLPLIKKGITCKIKHKPFAATPFPWWGYASFISLAFFWVIAWTRLSFFAPFQAHTFFPLWLSFIISINAMTFRKKKSCPLLESKSRFSLLFLVSAIFWWIFEYLNRFVGNWHYTGSQYPALQYFLLATLSFSTVLPAVASMKEYLLTFDRFQYGFKNAWPIKKIDTRPFALSLIITACIPLYLISLFPDILFFTVWISPFFILLGFRIFSGRPHILSRLNHGDFTMVAAYATSALICGFFWEMFNMYSLARWQYSIPYVDVLHIFEMPILGYAGYLPFGLECALIINLVMEPNKS